MKKTLSIALAATVAASAIAFSAADASAAPYWKGKWNGGWNRWNGGAAAAVIGGIVGLGILSQAYRPYYGYGYGYPAYGYGYGYGYPYRYSYPAYGYSTYGGGSAHVQWCLNRYRTYNPATNTYFIRVGVPAVCHSPFG
jgi:hypothetical protein